MDYPLQLYKTGRPKLVFSVDGHFGTNEENPLSIYAGWARFVFTLIDKREPETKTPFCNITMPTFELIEERVRNLCMRSFSESFLKPLTAAENAPSLDDEVVKLLSQRVPFNSTLRAALTEKGGYKGIDSLIATYMKGAEKYVLNKSAIATLNKLKAIGEKAVTNALTAERTAETTTTANKIVVHEAVRPLSSRKPHANGDSFCYEVVLTYNPQMTSKWGLVIRNFYAPLKRNENGTTNVVSSQRHDVTESKIVLTDDEMLSAVNAMSRAKKAYETNVFPALLETAQKAYDAARRGE